MSKLTDYWTQPRGAQNELLKEVTPPPARSCIRVKPPGCICKHADAQQCYAHRHAQLASNPPHAASVLRDALASEMECVCPCHSDCGGEG